MLLVKSKLSGLNLKLMKKRVFLILLFLLLVFLNIFPHFYAFKNTPPGFIFSGQASWFDPWDINVYIAAIRSGQEYGILLQNTFTTTSHQSALVYPTYTLVGQIFKTSSIFSLFYFYSFLVTLLLIVSLYFFIKIFLKKTIYQLIALFLISLGGGVGWLFFPRPLGADLNVTGFTFFSSWQRPHEALGIIFYFGSLIFLYLGLEKNKSKEVLKAFLFSLPLVCLYPYYYLGLGLISFSFTIFIYLKKGEEHFRKLFLFFIPLAILFFIYFLHLKNSIAFQGQLFQKLKVISPIELIVGYGILLPLLIYRLKSAKKDSGFVFLNLWFWISLLLSFVPFGFARFFLRGLFFPGVILVLKLAANKKELAKIRLSRESLLIVLVVLLPISSFFIFFKRIEEVKNNNSWYYLSADNQQVFDYFNQKDKTNKNVLAAYNFGNQLPSHSRARVYLGHLIQTPRAQEKLNKIYAFYQQKYNLKEAKEFLTEARVDYVFFGQEEKQIAQKQTLDYPFLKPIFKTEDMILFEITNHHQT